VNARTVVTVGSFDGLHLGHRAVLEEIAERARRTGRRSVVVTFVPHPLEIVNPQAAPPLLTLDDERRELLAQTSVDAVAFFPFTTELSHYTPAAFVRLLLERFRLTELVIGHDHGFGRGRTGDVEVLRSLGAALDFAVDVVPPVVVDGREVSSTLVRRAIAGGDLATAARHLGRRYSMVGAVVRGASRGRDLGYPTINVAVPDTRKLLPPDGVYAVRAEWANGSAGGMMHIGPRPTFGEAARSLEAHLFRTTEDLYGRRVKLTWFSRLRDVITFPSADALRRQLDRDMRDAIAALAVPPRGASG
jgi:riboflavin kinase/FMN adenylyltransferase